MQSSKGLLFGIMFLVLVGTALASGEVYFFDGGENGTATGNGWVGSGATCSYSTDHVKFGSYGIKISGGGGRFACLYNIENIPFPYVVEGWMYDPGTTLAANGTNFQIEMFLGNYNVYHNHLHRKTNDNGPIENGICQDEYKWTIPGTTPISFQPREDCTGVTMKTGDFVKFEFYVYNRTWMTYVVDGVVVRNNTVGDTGNPFAIGLSADSPLGGVTYFDNVSIRNMTGAYVPPVTPPVQDEDLSGALTASIAIFIVLVLLVMGHSIMGSLSSGAQLSSMSWAFIGGIACLLIALLLVLFSVL